MSKKVYIVYYSYMGEEPTNIHVFMSKAEAEGFIAGQDWEKPWVLTSAKMGEQRDG